MAQREASGKTLKHQNGPHGFPVVTAQEKEMEVLAPTSVRREGGRFEAEVGRVEYAG